MYLDRWAVGWKSNHWKPRDSKTLAAAASSAALTSASSNPLAAPLSSSLLHAHESVGALAQMDGGAVEGVSDGSWETDDGDADDNDDDDDDDDESELSLPQRVPSPPATAAAKRKALHAQSSPSSASDAQDWEACEHRCFAFRTSGRSL